MFTSVIIRGLPGSGKSTLADTIQSMFRRVFLRCEADDFFTNYLGTYKFEPDKLQRSVAAWNKRTN